MDALFLRLMYHTHNGGNETQVNDRKKEILMTFLARGVQNELI